MSEIVDCIAFVVQKSCWSLWVFTSFVAKRIGDLLGLVFNVLACLTIIRLPCMIQQFREIETLCEWRYVGLVQLAIFLMDIPFILMGLFLIGFSLGFILIPLVREIKKKDVKCDYSHEMGGIYYGGFELRKIVASYFFRFLCDIFCLPLAVVCFFSWRCCIFLKKLRKEDYRWKDLKWREICVVQFFQLLIDIPCILIGLLVMFTWRAPFLVLEVKRVRTKRKDWDTWRLKAFPEFFLVFVDLVCLFFFLATIVTWRGPILVYRLYHAKKEQWVLRRITAEQMLLIAVDIPCILCALVVFVTLWRVPNFIRNLKKDEWKLRLNSVCQLGMLLVDLGCFVLSLVVMATLWRLYPLIRSIRKHFSRPEGERSWKIRKAICKNFVFLLVDIPALFLCFVILVTLFRFPKLLSKFIQAGDFYMEFAITVYYESAMLVVDLFFVVLFVLLICLRPIQSWVHLLEDEEHKKNRLLRHYMQWVPDIIALRLKMRRQIEEVFSKCLKNKEEDWKLKIYLKAVNDSYLDELEWIRAKVKKYELAEEVSHLVNMAKWWEKKRVDKLVRLYRCELNFLLRPVISVHNANLSKFRIEMIRFEGHVSDQYSAIENYVIPKVPLWTEECGLRARTRKESQQALIKCLRTGNFLMLILLLLNVLLIYRGPALLKHLFRRWYDRRNIIFASCREYLLDFVAVLRILLVILLLYRAPFLITDIARDIFLKHSWKAVRKTAERYPPLVLEDIVQLFSVFLSWQSIRFVFTALLFGLVMPADLFLTIMKSFCAKCCAYLGTIILYAIFMGFPVVLPFYLSGVLSASLLNIVIGVFAFALLLSLILMVVVLLRTHGRENELLVKPPPYDYVRFNWTNIHVIVFEAVEFLQLLALVFVIGDIPMTGAQTLNSAAQYLLLNFASFEVKLWLTFVLFVIWFFCCGAPVILENVLEHLPPGSCAKHIGWALFLSLFANTLFVTMVESFLTFVSCKSTECSLANDTSDGNVSAHAACLPVVLRENPSMECWDGDHKLVALLGMLGLVWYSTTAVIFGTKYGDVEHPSQDFKFSPVYNIFINFIKALMVGVVVLGVARPTIVFSFLLAANLAAVTFTLSFKKILDFDLSNSLVLKIWRAVTFICGCVSAVAALIAESQGVPDSIVPLVVFLGGSGLVLVVAVVVSIVLRNRRTPVENERVRFRQKLQTLEQRLMRENYMVNSWGKSRAKWKRLVSHVYEAQKGDRDVPPTVWSHLEIPPPPPPGEFPVNQPLDTEQSTSASLPPPPSYDELFPHIMGPYNTPPVPPPPYPEGSETRDAPLSPPSCDETKDPMDLDGDGATLTREDYPVVPYKQVPSEEVAIDVEVAEEPADSDETRVDTCQVRNTLMWPSLFVSWTKVK